MSTSLASWSRRVGRLVVGPFIKHCISRGKRPRADVVPAARCHAKTRTRSQVYGGWQSTENPELPADITFVIMRIHMHAAAGYAPRETPASTACCMHRRVRKHVARVTRPADDVPCHSDVNRNTRYRGIPPRGRNFAGRRAAGAHRGKRGD